VELPATLSPAAGFAADVVSMATEEALHFGLIPRSNRGIFCMNELPDLAARLADVDLAKLTLRDGWQTIR
jgi:Mg-chelatase subunit ChlI